MDCLSDDFPFCIILTLVNFIVYKCCLLKFISLLGSACELCLWWYFCCVGCPGGADLSLWAKHTWIHHASWSSAQNIPGWSHQAPPHPPEELQQHQWSGKCPFLSYFWCQLFIRLHSDLIMVTGHLVIFIVFTRYSTFCHHVSYYSMSQAVLIKLDVCFSTCVPEYMFTVLFSFVLFIQSSPSNTIGRTPPRHPSSRTSPLTSPTNSSHTGLSPR